MRPLTQPPGWILERALRASSLFGTHGVSGGLVDVRTERGTRETRMVQDRIAVVAEYLRSWHARHAGATSSVLGDLGDSEGRSSYDALAETVSDCVGPAMDVACGDGALLALLSRSGGWFGLDNSDTEIAAARCRLPLLPVIRGVAAAVPVRSEVLGAVTCHYALMLLQPLEDVLVEILRVLRPGGVFAAVVPSAEASDARGDDDCWSVFRRAASVAFHDSHVDIPPIQDGRALERQALSRLLEGTGFSSIAFSTFAASKRISVDDAVYRMMHTYGPDLLPSKGYASLEATLREQLPNSASADGLIRFEMASTIITAQRHS